MQPVTRSMPERDSVTLLGSQDTRDTAVHTLSSLLGGQESLPPVQPPRDLRAYSHTVALAAADDGDSSVASYVHATRVLRGELEGCSRTPSSRSSVHEEDHSHALYNPTYESCHLLNQQISQHTRGGSANPSLSTSVSITLHPLPDVRHWPPAPPSPSFDSAEYYLLPGHAARAVGVNVATETFPEKRSWFDALCDFFYAWSQGDQRVETAATHIEYPPMSPLSNVWATIEALMIVAAFLTGLTGLLVAFLGLSTAHLAIDGQKAAATPPPPPPSSTLFGGPVTRIAFGSKYQTSPGNNTVWLEGVLPTQPDAWIWTGNMAYLSQGPLDCSDPLNALHPSCVCTPSYLRQPPLACRSASLSNAVQQMAAMLSTGYDAFLNYMCPGFYAQTAAVPPGADPAACPRPILGVYGDKDYGWSGGDRRMPGKGEIKQVFLDGVGAGSDSVQRRQSRGTYSHAKLPSGSDDWVDVILLDERYERAPMPCARRRQHCQLPAYAATAWCADFLGSGTVASPGSCCKQDDDIADKWCLAASSQSDARYAAACQPWSSKFGATKFGLDLVTGELLSDPAPNWRQAEESAGFCDVLGQTQRRWLQGLLQSKSSVKLVVAPSGLLGNPSLANTPVNDYAGSCANDWDCFPQAQISVLHMLSNATGCVIVLSGDAPYADFKAVRASSVLPYAGPYKAQYLSKSVFQATTTGMHASTAPGVDSSCGLPCCGRNLDVSGLRIGGTCAVYGEPSFGLLTIDWEARTLKMGILRADGGGVASTVGAVGVSSPVSMEFEIDLGSCLYKA